MFPMHQILLLVFFFLTPGVDALRCIHCIPKDKEGTCDLGICEINPAIETCHVLKIYSHGTSNELILRETVVDCKKKEDAKCGVHGNVPRKRAYIVHGCCADSDLCNGNM